MKPIVLALGLAALVAPAAAAQQQHITLQDAIALAQQRSPQFLEARASRDQSRYLNRAFSAHRLPQLSLAGSLPSYNRSIIPVTQPDGSTLFRAQQQTSTQLGLSLSQVLPITGGSLFVSSGLSRLLVSGDQSLETWSSTPVTVGISQDIFRPNEASWDRRVQTASFERDERVYRQALEDVALQATELFFNAYSAGAELRNAISNAAVNDTLYKINTGRFAVGRIGENDLLQSELALLRARSALEGARISDERARETFRLGVGLPQGVGFDLVVTPAVPAYEPDTIQAVARALESGTTVSDIALQQLQARRRVTEAKLQNGLGATVSASYGFNATASQAHLAYQNLLEARQFTLSVQMPIWQWGGHSETVRAAQSDRERTDIQASATRDQVAMDAHFAALQLGQARRSLAILVEADSVAGRRYDVAYNRYVTGRITIDNLYIAQAEKDAALTQYAEGLRHFWEAHYLLRRMTLYDFEAGQPIR
ncbi:MAG TPA: TolC family protein [Gemmatimonadales bacterium]|jgi:outer membrane protein TolC